MVEDPDQLKSIPGARSSRALLAAILDNVGEAVISIGEDQRITMFKKRAKEVFGYSAEEAIAMPMGTLVRTRFRDAHNRYALGFLASGESSRRMDGRVEIVGLRRDRNEFPCRAQEVDLRCLSMTDLGGKLLLERQFVGGSLDFVGSWAIAAFFKPKALLVAENLRLRQQLLVQRRRHSRLQMEDADRRFWILASRWFPGWWPSLLIVKPETVLGCTAMGGGPPGAGGRGPEAHVGATGFPWS